MQLEDIAEARNLVALFLARADELGERPMLWAKREGDWQALSWAEAARRVAQAAEALRALGLAAGDRVVLVGENRPEWCLADLAIMAAGCVTVPAYSTNTARDHLHVLTDSGARAAIVSTPKLAKPLAEAMRQVEAAGLLIGMDALGDVEGLRIQTWPAMIEGDASAARAAVDARVAGIARGDLACLIYTSGTGGAPKGVRHHHGAILHNVYGAAALITEDFGWAKPKAGSEEAEVFLSFLPLSHAYEHSAGQFLPIGLGAEIYYAQGLDKLASNIAEVRPTIMVVVPRLFEMLRTRILAQIAKQGRVANLLLEQALGAERRRASGKPRLGDRVADIAVERLLRPKIRERFGGRIKAMVSGGAPLNPEIGWFFQGLGLTLLQGYGQTESAPIISVNRPRAGIRMDSVGPPLAHTEVRIADDGEILVRGELVMHGYWNNDAASAEALAGGWLHTGDIGHLDGAGRIVITDRKKDMIVLDKGDNVAPQRIEGMLALQPEIAQAMVVGDRRPFVVALVVPDADWAKTWAAANGATGNVAALQDNHAFRAAVRAAVDRVGRELSVTERVRQFAFADEPFTVDNGELTPSLKTKRHKLRERYGERLDALYKD